MKNSRKKIIQEIELLDRELQYHQIQGSLHKHALIQFLKDNQITIVACLLPLLYFIPWKKLPLRSFLLGSGLGLQQLTRQLLLRTINKKFVAK